MKNMAITTAATTTTTIITITLTISRQYCNNSTHNKKGINIVDTHMKRNSNNNSNINNNTDNNKNIVALQPFKETFKAQNRNENLKLAK